MPVSVRKRFADVSEHNGPFDWDEYAAREYGADAGLPGKAVVIVRTSDGDRRDVLWTPQRERELRNARVTFGVYPFGRGPAQSNGWRKAAEECRVELEIAHKGGWGEHGVDLRMAYDAETLNGNSASVMMRHTVEWVTEYHQREHYFPALYTMPGYWNRISPFLAALGEDAIDTIRRCPLWIADWGISVPHRLAPWEAGPTGKRPSRVGDYLKTRHYAAWQTTETTSFAGSPDPTVDGNTIGPNMAAMLIPRRPE